ncbi:nuclear transport factor 2 family protein [Paenibacillus taichungensis]|uniref:nuclear transport factor 2 family protein n=1 Tax=Paenibacillus taichungensis TaxID=484184 RepID=UPI002DBEC1AA|nr:nuclear transport factor 2 family protein [Paenibacillus taichungensis]MEC0106910.1 nuclear transport factor 2 family protein [Paenibacillus taichungensis]MEC0195160.1 nuclear transport factor 2 family protein [Paenibacillus taichungensis]
MENSNLKDLIEKYLSAYNTFNIDGMIGVLNENIHFRNISKGEVNSETKGIQEFRTLAEQSIQVFSQRRQVIKNIIFAGDKAEVDIDYEGILSSDLPNGMKAGETLKLQGKSIFQIKDKKLILIEDLS